LIVLSAVIAIIAVRNALPAPAVESARRVHFTQQPGRATTLGRNARDTIAAFPPGGMHNAPGGTNTSWDADFNRPSEWAAILAQVD